MAAGFDTEGLKKAQEVIKHIAEKQHNLLAISTIFILKIIPIVVENPFVLFVVYLRNLIHYR